MGYVRHDAVIVTVDGYVYSPNPRVPVPDVEVFRDSLPDDWRRLVVGPVTSVANDYVTFAFLPDGSKEGFPDSELGDEYRQRFVDLFSFREEDGSTPFDVVTVNFGGSAPKGPLVAWSNEDAGAKPGQAG